MLEAKKHFKVFHAFDILYKTLFTITSQMSVIYGGIRSSQDTIKSDLFHNYCNALTMDVEMEVVFRFFLDILMEFPMVVDEEEVKM